MLRIFAFSDELDPSGERLLTWAYDDRPLNPYSPVMQSKTLVIPVSSLPKDDVALLDEAIKDLLEIAEIINRDAGPSRDAGASRDADANG